MKIAIAPDSYKESLSAMQVANTIEKGFKQIFPLAEYIKIPIADGGEGTVDTMIEATNGEKVFVDVTNALGEKQQAFWGVSQDKKVAFIEIAAACGIEQVPSSERNPLITTSYGVGELILSALDKGVRHFIIGLGGSATNDGGLGMLQALGAKFIRTDGASLGLGGGQLSYLHSIDLSQFDERIKDSVFEIACDVTNPLVGQQGASAIFGPQKGATPEMVTQLDFALTHYADVIEKTLNIQVKDLPGAGAAGGLGAAFAAFFNAQLKSGIGIITQLLDLENKVKDANLVITGEGRLDHQSIKGKVPIGVAAVAKKHNIPVIGIAGSLGQDINVVYNHGLDAVFSILTKVSTLPEALQEAEKNLEITSRNIAAILKMNLSA